MTTNAALTATADTVTKAVKVVHPSIDTGDIAKVADVCKALAMTKTRPITASEMFAEEETREDAMGVIRALSRKGLIVLIGADTNDGVFYSAGQSLDGHFQSNAALLGELLVRHAAARATVDAAGTAATQLHEAAWVTGQVSAAENRLLQDANDSRARTEKWANVLAQAEDKLKALSAWQPMDH